MRWRLIFWFWIVPLAAHAGCPYFIAIAGGSASGKTTLAKKLVANFGPGAVLIHQDDYYNFDLQPKDLYIDGVPNFDHPTAMDFPAMRRQLAAIRRGDTAWIPQFEYATWKSISHAREVAPGVKLVVFEGIHALHDPEIRALMDLNIFLEEDADVRLARRITRDIEERGQTVPGVLKFYFAMARPMHDEFVQPSKAFADVVIHGEVPREKP